MLKKLLVFTLLTAAAFSVFSQQSEDKLMERADGLFAEQKYAEAFPVYSQLVSLHPQSPVLNFKFGACAVYTGEGQTTSIKHLNFAIQKGVKNPLAHYFLGRAYHLNYEFEEAIDSYEKFRQKADKDQLEEFEVESLIEQCEFGKSLLSSIKEVVVLEKTEASINDYFRYYNLDNIGGRMLTTPEELLSRIDKKKDYQSTIHYGGVETEVYFPSYGKDEETGTDIYRAYLLPDGKWSDPEKVEGFVNTQQNEDFAFYHNESKTLYFASEGHNSMGGFDIFKSQYNESDGSFGPPENMDFAVNTPADDIFYVVDKKKETAYFSSDRTSSQNKMHVYKVKVKTIPLNVVAIEGDFISEINPSQKNATIRVMAGADKRLISTENSDDITGDYALTFDRPGNYTLEVEVEGSAYIHEANLRIPEFDRPVLVQQKMRLVKEDGAEKLIVDNLFDNPQDLDLADVSLDVIRQKAGLDVNADDPLLADTESNSDQDANPAVRAGFSEGTTSEDVIAQMDEKITELSEAEKKESRKSSSFVALAERKQSRADSLLKEISDLRSQLDKTDKEKYLEDLAQLSDLMSEVKKLNVEVAAALKLSERSEEFSADLEEKKEAVVSRKNSAQEALTAGREEELFEALKAEHDDQRIQKEETKSPGEIAARTKAEKEKESRELYEDVEDLKSDARSVMRDLQVMRERLAATADRKDKEEVQMRVNQLESEYEILKSDIDRKREQANEAVDVANLAGAQVFLYNTKDESVGQSEELKGEPLEQKRTELTTELTSIEKRTAELDFNDEESMVLASDEMKFTRNDIKSVALVENYQDRSPIELKKSDQLQESVDAFSSKFYTEEISPQEVERTSAELTSQIEEHLEFWNKELAQASESDRQTIRREIEEMNRLKSQLDIIDQASQQDVAQNASTTQKDVADASSSSASSQENADSGEDAIDRNNTQENADDVATSQVELDESGTGTTDGEEDAVEFTEQSEEVSAGQNESEALAAELNKEEIPSVTDVENEEVKSLAESLPQVNSLTEYDAQSQQLIQLDNQLREEIEEETDPSKIDSLEAARDDVKKAQFDLKTLDKIYVDELNEINDKNTSEQTKSKQEIELNRKFAQLIDKKKFQLESYKSREEEVPFSAQKMNQELENRKYKAMTRMNGLRTELETGQEANPNLLAENATEETPSENTQPQGVSAEDTSSELTEVSATENSLSQDLEEESVSEETAEVIASEPVELRLKANLDEPSEVEMDAAYDSETFEEMYSAQAGVNLRFRNEDDISELKTEISELQSQVDNGDESSRTIRKLDNAILDLAEEEARNGTKVRRMVEQTLEDYDDVIGTQRRISGDDLTAQEMEYVELLESAVQRNMTKADSLRGVAMNESNPVDQNLLFKKAYVYESRAIESKKAIAKVYEDGSWNEDLVARSSANPKSTNNEMAETAEMPGGGQQETTESNVVSEQVSQDDSSEEVASNTEDSALPVAEESPEQITNEDESTLTLNETTRNEEPASRFDENTKGNEEQEARKMVVAQVNQREAFEKELSPNQLEELESDDQFAEYNQQVEEIKEQQKNLGETISDLQQKKRAYAEVNTQIESLEKELAATSEPEEKQKIEDEITRLRVKAEVKYKEVREAREKTRQQATMLDAAIVEAETDFKALITGIKSRPSRKFENATAADLARLEMPKTLNENLFARSQSSVYSEENPIPEVTEMPDGIVYQVQVGAFRNPIPQDHFREFAPVMAHNLNNGITRYTVGLFNQFDVAQGVRDQVRELGYSDAFVVAYRNGERISTDEARGAEDAPLAEARSEETRLEESPIAENTSGNAEDERVVESTSVSEINGVFFTVQIGVFSKPVKKSELDITPLNRDKTASGLTRYTTGVFNDYNSADQRKAEVRNSGISDAFVTAYYNGERISVDRARQLASENAQPEREEPKEQFIVFIGRFENQVPSDVARAMLMLEGRYGVVQENKSDYTDYFTKPVNSRMEAERIQAAFREFDVENTEIRTVSGDL
ncbi:hypothetical protein [Halocola ammonii]